MKTTEFETGKKYTRSSLAEGSYAFINYEGYFYLKSAHFGECQLVLSKPDLEIDDWVELA